MLVSQEGVVSEAFERQDAVATAGRIFGEAPTKPPFLNALMGETDMRCFPSFLVLASLAIAQPVPVASQADMSSLEAFGALVIGEWAGDGARHVFSWGVGRRLIHTSSYFVEDEGWKLVSEGIWYADESDGTVRSVQIAIDMPVERFEYRSHVRGTRIEHELEAFGAAPGRFIEIWSFSDRGYDWWLESPEDPGQRLMGGSFERIVRGGAGPGS